MAGSQEEMLGKLIIRYPSLQASMDNITMAVCSPPNCIHTIPLLAGYSHRWGNQPTNIYMLNLMPYCQQMGLLMSRQEVEFIFKHIIYVIENGNNIDYVRNMLYKQWHNENLNLFKIYRTMDFVSPDAAQLFLRAVEMVMASRFMQLSRENPYTYITDIIDWLCPMEEYETCDPTSYDMAFQCWNVGQKYFPRKLYNCVTKFVRFGCKHRCVLNKLTAIKTKREAWHIYLRVTGHCGIKRKARKHAQMLCNSRILDIVDNMHTEQLIQHDG